MTGETAVLKATKNIKKEEKFDLEGMMPFKVLFICVDRNCKVHRRCCEYCLSLISGFDLAMFVMHPFLRLVSSYSRIRDDSNTQLSEKIKALVGKDFTFEVNNRVYN